MQEIKKINLSLNFDYYYLGDLVKIKYGKNQKKVQDDENGQYPIFGTGGLMGYSIEYLYDKPSVLIGRKGSIEKVRYIEEPFWTVDTLFYTEVNKKIVIPKFLYYVMSLIDLSRYNEGTSIPSLRTETLNSLDLPIPDLDYQNRVLSVLSKIDKKIEINEKINKNLQELAKSIYRYHFIDFEPYSQDNFISSTLGEIPENWCVQSIGEFVDDMKNGGTPKRGESDYWDNGTVPWLKTGEINNNIIIKSEEHITESGLKNSSAKLLPINSIIIALYGKGTAARIGLLKLEATTNQACCAMICEDFNKALFLYLFLLFNQKEIENLASGSVQQNLSKDLITNLELVVPPTEIIEKLPFKEIYDKISNNYFEIEYLTNLRDTLLPKLMSGEIDVSKINCDLELKYNYMKYLFNQIHTPMSNSVV